MRTITTLNLPSPNFSGLVAATGGAASDSSLGEGPIAGPKCVILNERREQSQIITKEGTHRGFIIAWGGTDSAFSGDLGEMLASTELQVDPVINVRPTWVEIGSGEGAEMPGLQGAVITGPSG